MRGLVLLACLACVIACHLATSQPCIRSKVRLAGRLTGNLGAGRNKWRGQEKIYNKGRLYGAERDAPVPSNSNTQNVVQNHYITVVNNNDNKNNIKNINHHGAAQVQQGQSASLQGAASQSSSAVASAKESEASASQYAQAQSGYGAAQSDYGEAVQTGYGAAQSGYGAAVQTGYGAATAAQSGYGAAIESGYGAAAQGAYAESVKGSTSTKETYRKIEEGSKETASQYEASKMGRVGASLAGARKAVYVG